MNIIGFMGVFLLAQTFKIIKYINQGKLVGGEILDYILNLLPKMFVETAPLSVLLAGLITISRNCFIKNIRNKIFKDS